MKRLIVCCDGTWNTPDQTDRGAICPSNVVKMARAVLPCAPDGTAQVTFYDRGVGTGFGLDRITGGAFGRGLSRNVEDGYRFLVHNYAPGDEIYLFGFSRGAYTARSLAGLIRNCGLLHKGAAERIAEAYGIYRDPGVHPDSDSARAFRARHAREPRIHLLGVWDTVGALGIPLSGLRWVSRRRFQFHDVKLSRSIDRAYHAVAVDEQRASFRPTLWETQPAPYQVVEQVWFAGSHCNVGGGYRDSGLSDVSFLWMADRAAAAGLALDPARLGEDCRPDPMGLLRDSRRGFYRLLPRYSRPIGCVPAGCEAVHPAVRERLEAPGLKYRPANLVKFLQRSGLNRFSSGPS